MVVVGKCKAAAISPHDMPAIVWAVQAGPLHHCVTTLAIRDQVDGRVQDRVEVRQSAGSYFDEALPGSTTGHDHLAALDGYLRWLDQHTTGGYLQ